MESGALVRSGSACGVRPKRPSLPSAKIPTLASVRRTRYSDGPCTPAAAANVSVSSAPSFRRSAMPSRATTQIAREIQKPSACWSSASAGGVPSVLIAPTSQLDAVDSPSEDLKLDHHGYAIKQLLPDEGALLTPAHSPAAACSRSLLGRGVDEKPSLANAAHRAIPSAHWSIPSSAPFASSDPPWP